jgi:hypothetical protein
MSVSPRLLAEAAVDLIVTAIQTNITAALANVRSYWHDGEVTTESPPTGSYFIYPKARGYRCPAIFVIDEGPHDFRQSELKSNFVNAKLSINVSVKIEDKDAYKLTLKAWRYASALHQILEQATLVSSDNTVKIVVIVKRAKPGPLYAVENDDSDQTAAFFKEYVFYCDVEFYEAL